MQSAFTLPGGLLGSSGTRIRRGWLRPLNGADEEWIHGLPSDISQAAVVTGMLARCVRRIGQHRVTAGMARRLAVGDRDFLMLKLYQATFGDVLSLLPICPDRGCRAKMDLDLAVADIPIEERPVETSYRLALDGEPRTEIEFRLPCGADQERLATAKGVSAVALREMLLDGCTLSGDRPAGSSDALAEAIELRAPGVELEVELHCPECGHRFELDLDVAAIFLREVARRRAAFDREIHLLAFHYRWPLQELFSLTAPRRQRFVRLLGDELVGQRR